MEILAVGNAVDAVLYANDEVAMGMYRAARVNGVRVPDDVAITGWDDTAASAQLHPSLTTVRQPMRELGTRVAAALFDRIDGCKPSSQGITHGRSFESALTEPTSQISRRS